MLSPYLGAHPWRDDDPPEGASAILAKEVGYLKFIDIEALSQICEKADLTIHLPYNSGAMLYEDTQLAWVSGELSREVEEDIREQFILAVTRTFEQDPRFGLIVMAEVGSRALSSATNDAGTAIEVITRLTRLLATWSKGREDEPVRYPRLHVRPLSDADMFDDAFLIIGRDGAHLVEIQLRLHKSLKALSRMGSPSFRQAASNHLALMITRAKASAMLPEDLDHLSDTLARIT